MGKFKKVAENLYLVGLVDKDGNYKEGDFFGNSADFVRAYLEEIGFRVMSVTLLEEVTFVFEKLEGAN